LLTEHFVVNRLEGLSATSALDFNVGVSDGRVERFQLRQKLSARLQELALAAQLVQALRAVAQPFVKPSLRIPQLPLDAPQLTCQRRDLAIQ
jgi:hypothetical protein